MGILAVDLVDSNILMGILAVTSQHLLGILIIKKGKSVSPGEILKIVAYVVWGLGIIWAAWSNSGFGTMGYLCFLCFPVVILSFIVTFPYRNSISGGYTPIFRRPARCTKKRVSRIILNEGF